MMRHKKHSHKTKAGLKKRFASGFTAALTLFVFGLFLFHQPIIEAGVHHQIEVGTGMKAELQHFNFNLRGGEFWINNLKVRNPEGYSDEIMFDLPRVYVKQAPRYFFHSARGVDQVTMHFKRVYLIKNERGELNVRAMRKDSGVLEKMNFFVRKLDIKLDEVVYKDYTVGKVPVVHILDAGVREVLLEVRDVAGAIEDIIFKGVRKGIMRQAVDLNPSSVLRNYIFDPLTYATSYLGKAAAEALPLSLRLLSCARDAARRMTEKTAGLLTVANSSEHQPADTPFVPGVIV